MRGHSAPPRFVPESEEASQRRCSPALAGPTVHCSPQEQTGAPTFPPVLPTPPISQASEQMPLTPTPTLCLNCFVR